MLFIVIGIIRFLVDFYVLMHFGVGLFVCGVSSVIILSRVAHNAIINEDDDDDDDEQHPQQCFLGVFCYRNRSISTQDDGVTSHC